VIRVPAPPTSETIHSAASTGPSNLCSSIVRAVFTLSAGTTSLNPIKRLLNWTVNSGCRINRQVTNGTRVLAHSIAVRDRSISLWITVARSRSYLDQMLSTNAGLRTEPPEVTGARSVYRSLTWAKLSAEPLATLPVFLSPCTIFRFLLGRMFSDEKDAK